MEGLIRKVQSGSQLLISQAVCDLSDASIKELNQLLTPFLQASPYQLSNVKSLQSLIACVCMAGSPYACSMGCESVVSLCTRYPSISQWVCKELLSRKATGDAFAVCQCVVSIMEYDLQREGSEPTLWKRSVHELQGVLHQSVEMWSSLCASLQLLVNRYTEESESTTSVFSSLVFPLCSYALTHSGVDSGAQLQMQNILMAALTISPVAARNVCTEILLVLQGTEQCEHTFLSLCSVLLKKWSVSLGSISNNDSISGSISNDSISSRPYLIGLICYCLKATGAMKTSANRLCLLVQCRTALRAFLMSYQMRGESVLPRLPGCILVHLAALLQSASLWEQETLLDIVALVLRMDTHWNPVIRSMFFLPWITFEHTISRHPTVSKLVSEMKQLLTEGPQLQEVEKPTSDGGENIFLSSESAEAHLVSQLSATLCGVTAASHWLNRLCVAMEAVTIDSNTLLDMGEDWQLHGFEKEAHTGQDKGLYDPKVQHVWDTTDHKIPVWIPQMVASIFSTTAVSNSNLTSICLVAMEMLARDDQSLGPSLLAAILHRLAVERDTKTMLELLHGIPSLTVSKLCVTQVLSFIQNLPKSHMRLEKGNCLRLTLLTQTWIRQDRTFPFLLKEFSLVIADIDLSRDDDHNVTTSCDSSGQSEKELTLSMCLRTVCMQSPQLRGPEILHLLSTILKRNRYAPLCAGADEKDIRFAFSATYCCLALDSLHKLIEKRVLDVTSLWTALEDFFNVEQRTPVLKKICEILSLIPPHDDHTDAYEALFSHALSLLWGWTRSDDVGLIMSSLMALAHYPLDSFSNALVLNQPASLDDTAEETYRLTSPATTVTILSSLKHVPTNASQALSFFLNQHHIDPEHGGLSRVRRSNLPGAAHPK